MIAVALDGFLRTHAKVQVPYAIKVFSDLMRMFPTTVMCDGDADEGDLWLRNRGLRDYVGILGEDVLTRNNESLRQAQYATLRINGPIEFAIDPDPGIAAWLVASGTPCLLHLNPSYSRPEFRPDASGIRRWDEILDELDRQEKMIASDTRLRATDGSGRFE